MKSEHRDRAGDLSSLLHDLSAYVEFPATPPLAPAVRQSLAARSMPAGKRGFSLLSLPGLATLIAAVALLLGVVLVASPNARAAVSRWLAIPGIELRAGSPSHLAFGHGLHLGRRVALAEARRQTPFHIYVPTAPSLKAPDAVYLANSDAGQVVSLLYRSRPDIPPARATHVAVLITELQAKLDTLAFRKFFYGRWPRRQNLGRSGGYWIPAVWVPSGHLLIPYLYGSGFGGMQFYSGRARLAANVLLWQRGTISLRLESSLSGPRAALIARSMR